MSIFSLVKHTNVVLKNARMLTGSTRVASGGWGRSYINVDDSFMHTYCMNISFGAPRHYSGKINMTFNKNDPKLTPGISKERMSSVRTCSKKEESEIVKDAPLSYYTYT
jgi:hypothetical protein